MSIFPTKLQSNLLKTFNSKRKYIHHFSPFIKVHLNFMHYGHQREENISVLGFESEVCI